LLSLMCAIAVACARPVVRRVPSGTPGPQELAELWVDPGSQPRNLLTGVGDSGPQPASDARYDILKRDTTGYSITYHVRDEHGREWSVKIGPEARPEVASSRIVWAVGYHQVPSYFVERWIGVADAKGQLFGGSRFRPHDMGLKSDGLWSWQENPFVGTPPYQGLLALMMILNSTDLKNENNELYEITKAPKEGARRWYVVKDLGASLGETGKMDPRRGYLEGFEKWPFVRGVDHGFVRFAFNGRHKELLEHISVDDVRWICRRLGTLTDRQWRDAFHAGGFDGEETRRYVARIRQKIDEGLALP